MAFALLPFFQFFRGTPHQLAAIKELEESVPEGYWRRMLTGFRLGRKAAMTSRSTCLTSQQPRQQDRHWLQGVLQSSASAMVAAYYKKVTTDDEYNEIRAKFGDTTSVEAH